MYRIVERKWSDNHSTFIVEHNDHFLGLFKGWWKQAKDYLVSGDGKKHPLVFGNVEDAKSYVRAILPRELVESNVVQEYTDQIVKNELLEERQEGIPGEVEIKGFMKYFDNNLKSNEYKKD